MTDYKIGDKVELSDKACCGDGIGYINKIDGSTHPYQVTNQRPGTDDEFVWGAYVGADEILRIVPPMTDTNERMTEKQSTEPIYYYECQERAMAPGIGDGWPEIIEAPHTKNARLVRREGNPAQLRTDLAAMTERAEKAERQRKNTAAAVVLAQDIIAKHEAERDTLRSENAALRELVERLPVTADGVRVLVGDSVWHPQQVGEQACLVVSGEDGGCPPEYDGWFVSVVIDRAGGMALRSIEANIDECYSTSEAALAARKENEDPFPNLHKSHWIRKDDPDEE